MTNLVQLNNCAGCMRKRSLLSEHPTNFDFCKTLLHQLHQATVYTLLNTPHDSSGTIKQLRGLYAQAFFTFRTPYVYERMHCESQLRTNPAAAPCTDTAT